MTQESMCLPSVRPRRPAQAALRRSPLDALLDPRWFRALGDPTRVHLLACLAKCSGPCTVGEIAACCPVDLSVVSRHLRILEQAGLVTASRRGRTVLYAVRYEAVVRHLRDLARAIEQCIERCTPSRGPSSQSTASCRSRHSSVSAKGVRRVASRA